MKYAVVNVGGKQYKVSEGDVVIMERVQGKAEDVYTFPEVLLFMDGDIVEIGKPALTTVSVTGKILEHAKGDKIRVAKFKAKARYRKVRGFRPSISKIEITRIENLNKKKETKKVSEEKVKLDKKSE